MVGYQKSDNLTQNEKLFAGVFSGVMTRFVTQPLDIVKLRMQLQKKSALENQSKNRLFDVTRRILSEEGFMAFWHGYTLGQIQSVLSVGTQFYVYELATKYVAHSDISANYKPMLKFLSGMLAGGTSATIVMPLEVIRLRQMLVKEQYRGIINGARAVYRTGGVLAFYEGLSASLLQVGPAAGISFSVFQWVQPMVLSFLSDCSTDDCRQGHGNKNKPEHVLVASTIAGCLSGITSKTITYPFDLVKKRLQIASHEEDERFKPPSTSQKLFKCKNITSCLTETYRKEGFFGLFRGWKITVYKAQVTNVVAYTTYELTCHAIREFNMTYIPSE